MRKVVSLFDRLGMYRFGRAVSCLVSEPKPFMRMIRRYHFYKLPEGVNPRKIREGRPAILLLHGNHHNPGAFIDFIRYLQERDVGPFFTVFLPPGPVTRKDHEIVENALEEIAFLYEKEGFTFSYKIIGHSRGAEVAEHFLKDSRLKQLIALGNPISTLYSPRRKEILYEIDADKDILVQARSSLSNKRCLDLGHIGLLYSPKVFYQIHQWLEEV